MFGNSVSPPLVAALSDVVLEPLGLGGRGDSAALRLALGAVAPLRRQQLRQGLHGSWQAEEKDTGTMAVSGKMVPLNVENHGKSLLNPMVSKVV